MCHQTVGLIARELEASGVATVTLSSARDITVAGRVPRAVFIDFPLGHTAGRVGEPDLARSIVTAALELVPDAEPEQLVDLWHRWAETDDWKNDVFLPETDPVTGEERTADQRTERLADPQYQSDADENAAAETHDGQTCLVCEGIDF